MSLHSSPLNAESEPICESAVTGELDMIRARGNSNFTVVFLIPHTCRKYVRCLMRYLSPDPEQQEWKQDGTFVIQLVLLILYSS